MPPPPRLGEGGAWGVRCFKIIDPALSVLALTRCILFILINRSLTVAALDFVTYAPEPQP